MKSGRGSAALQAPDSTLTLVFAPLNCEEELSCSVHPSSFRMSRNSFGVFLCRQHRISCSAALVLLCTTTVACLLLAGVAVMSVGPDGRLLSPGPEEDLFARGWEWKAAIWLRGHQLMHLEQPPPPPPPVRRASFNYATFSVTLSLFCFFFSSSSLSNLGKSRGLWRLWLFSCLWQRAESLVTPPLLTLTLLKCALLSAKLSLPFLFCLCFFLFCFWIHSFCYCSALVSCVLGKWLYFIFLFLWEGQSIPMNKALRLCRNIYYY